MIIKKKVNGGNYFEIQALVKRMAKIIRKAHHQDKNFQ